MAHTLKVAAPEDVDSICAIDYELFPENNFNERTLHNQIVTGKGWLYHEEETLIGYMLVSGLDSPMVDILRLGVREKWRRQLVASQLLWIAKDLALGPFGIESKTGLMLNVRKSNVPAINLYRKHGFEITGTMPQHHSWVMQLRKTSS
jgi:ribosomal protein S18 acetylase RimI-like enzyme